MSSITLSREFQTILDNHIETEEEIPFDSLPSDIFTRSISLEEWEPTARTYRVVQFGKTVGYLHQTLGEYEWISTFKELQKIRVLEMPKAFAVEEEGKETRYYLADRNITPISRKEFYNALQAEESISTAQKAFAIGTSLLMCATPLVGLFKAGMNVLDSKVANFIVPLLITRNPLAGLAGFITLAGADWVAIEGPGVNCSWTGQNPSISVSKDGSRILTMWQDVSQMYNQRLVGYNLLDKDMNFFVPSTLWNASASFHQFFPRSAGLNHGFLISVHQSSIFTLFGETASNCLDCPRNITINLMDLFGNIISNSLNVDSGYVGNARPAEAANISLFLWAKSPPSTPSPPPNSVYSTVVDQNGTTSTINSYSLTFPKWPVLAGGNRFALCESEATINGDATRLVLLNLNGTLESSPIPLNTGANTLNRCDLCNFPDGQVVAISDSLNISVWLRFANGTLLPPWMATTYGYLLSVACGQSWYAVAWNSRINGTQTVQYVFRDYANVPLINTTILGADTPGAKSLGEIAPVQDGFLITYVAAGFGVVTNKVTLQNGTTPVPTPIPTPEPTPEPTQLQTSQPPTIVPTATTPRATNPQVSSNPPTSTNAQPISGSASSSSDGSNLGKILGGIFGALTALALGVAGFFGVRRYLQTREETQEGEEHELPKVNSAKNPPPGTIYDEFSGVVVAAKGNEEAVSQYEGISKVMERDNTYDNIPKEVVEARDRQYSNIPEGVRTLDRQYSNIPEGMRRTLDRQYSNIPKKV